MRPLIIGFKPRRIMPTFTVDGASIERAKRLYGEESELANLIIYEIREEALRLLAGYLDPVSWFTRDEDPAHGKGGAE